jgi:hypothetical protein
MRRLTRTEKAQRVWRGVLQEAWLRDHPDKTSYDYEIAGSCGDTEEGARAYHRWFDEWLEQEGRAIHRRVFRGTPLAQPLMKRVERSCAT